MPSLFFLLLLALPLASAAQAPDHRGLAKRAKGDVVKRTAGASNARWTFYSTGFGACGGYNSDSDFIVALNQQTFGYPYPSPFCGKKITMSYGGKTTTATIVDCCPGCPVGGLDLSPGLFSFFASQDMGVIYGDWSILDNSDHTTTKKTTTHETTSTTHTATHTTSTTHTLTKTTSSTTSTSTTPSAAEPTSSSSSSTTSSSHLPSSTVSNNVAAQSGTVAADSDAQPQNLRESSQALLNLLGLLAAARANAD
ncbi:RlpA-like double-psi beta-barrel-protein domain-containing protein-containing protein [Mycena filopes]|nr:RlpA-like double-psi beta-barrel-protein domain-containing protein-containing protein [Mycena filopes]